MVGRGNPRPNSLDYVTGYWAGNSGLPHQPLTKTDAIPYTPTAVVAEDIDAGGWRLSLDGKWTLLADDMNDALALPRVAERHSRICFIGRSNPRPNPNAYIMTYWE